MLQRYLDNRESQLLPVSAALAVGYEGHIESAALAGAWRLVCTRLPVLRGRIRSDEKGKLLYVPAGHQPEVRVLNGDEKVLQDEPRERWDVTRALSRLSLIRRDDRGFIVLRMSGAVTDRELSIKALDLLFRDYVAIVNGIEPSVTPGASLPLSPVDLLRDRAAVRFKSALLAADAQPDRIEFCSPIHRRIVLTKGETAQLIVAARDHDTTVHALLCGAILIAIRDHGTPTEPASMVCVSPIDLRHRVDPPLASDVTRFTIRVKCKVTIPAGGNVVAVGREVKRQIDDAIDAPGEVPPQEGIESPPAAVDTPLEQRLSTIVVSNGGVIPPFAESEALTVTDLMVLEEPVAPLMPIHVALTYAGRLNIKVTYPSVLFSDEEVDEIVKRTTMNLLHAGDR